MALRKRALAEPWSSDRQYPGDANDPLVQAYTAWLKAMDLLAYATGVAILNRDKGRTLGTQALDDAKPAMESVNTLTTERNVEVDPDLQQRWQSEVQAYGAAIGDYNPDAPPQQYGAVKPPTFAVDKDGVHIGSLVLSWASIGIIAAAAYYIWRGSKHGSRDAE